MKRSYACILLIVSAYSSVLAQDRTQFSRVSLFSEGIKETGFQYYQSFYKRKSDVGVRIKFPIGSNLNLVGGIGMSIQHPIISLREKLVLFHHSSIGINLRRSHIYSTSYHTSPDLQLSLGMSYPFYQRNVIFIRYGIGVARTNYSDHKGSWIPQTVLQIGFGFFNSRKGGESNA